MNYSGSSIEMVRFGARRGRESIGCCGLDLIQAFQNDPGEEGVFPLRWGDEDTFIYQEGGINCLRGTNEELFWAMLQVGSHDGEPKASRAFLAVLTEEQLADGSPWLKLLADAGFEFLRAFTNGVYGDDHGPLYLFGYFRVFPFYEFSLGPPDGWAALVQDARANGRGVPAFDPKLFYDKLVSIPESDING